MEAVEHPILSTIRAVTPKEGGVSMFITRPYKLRALREWNIRMSRNETPALFDCVMAHVLQYQGFDVSQVEPEPRSVYSVEKLYAQLEAFDPTTAVIVDINDKHVQSGIRLAYKIFAKPKQQDYLTPLAYYDESLISNWKASAGLTAFGEDKRSSFQRGVLSVQRILNFERKPEPCVALTRTQKKGKTRLVWGYPLSMTLLEGSFAKPILSQFKGGHTPMAFATTNKRLGSKILSAQNHNKFWYSLDMSQFDSSIQAEVIRVCFSILRTWFDVKEEYAFGLSAGKVLSMIENYFVHTPIVMPAGKESQSEGTLYLGKNKGVPSGSYFTQVIDSIANIIMLGTFASKFGFKISPRECFVLGDDLLFFTNTHIDVDEISTYGHKMFGMTINTSKTEHGSGDEPVPFLGRTWEKGLPMRDTVTAMKKMLYPENFRKYVNPRREGNLVALSYNVSALQSIKLIPYLNGWESLWNSPLDVLEAAGKLSGLLRYQLTHSDYREQFFSNCGSFNMLKVLG